jgi:formate dehydrogenase iron-sulfur subunit
MDDGHPMSVATEIAIKVPDAQKMGFFTDTTTCIGCKACEVACKQWNDLPADELREGKGKSYDYTGALSASTWRHVRFVETVKPTPDQREAARVQLAGGGGGALPAIPATEAALDPSGPLATASTPDRAAPGPIAEQLPSLVEMAEGRTGFSAPLGEFGQPAAAKGDSDGALLDRWVFMSDVCKHCTNAGCLDACPTGALIRTEFETVIVQPDICNGCGYCIPSCPFGVINRDPYDGRAAKCTLCYDRLEDGLEPACAKACPTDAIQFGAHEELVERAKGRVHELHERGLTGAYLYGAGDDPGEQLAGGLGAFFLLTEPPERFGLPAQADSPIQENGPPATAAGLVAGFTAMAITVGSLVVAHRRRG